MTVEAPAGPRDRRGCAATSKQTGQPCGQSPAPGATVCRHHGGEAPQVKAAAQRRLQQQQAEAALERYGMPVAVDWHVALQEGLDETYGNVLYLRNLVQQLAPEALTWGRSQTVQVGSGQFPGIDVTHAAGVAPLVELYGRERDRLHRMSLDAGKLGLDVRKQAFAERDGQTVASVIRGVLEDLGVDVSDPSVLRVVASRLRALAGPEQVTA